MVQAAQLDLLQALPAPSPAAERGAVPAVEGVERVLFGAIDWRVPSWGASVWKGPRTPQGLEQAGLGEYARHGAFGTVCIPCGRDPLEAPTLRRYAAELPPSFPVILEAPARITAPRLTRSGGFDVDHIRTNRDFLDPDVFLAEVLAPATEAFGDRLAGVLLVLPPDLRSAGVPPAGLTYRLGAFFDGLHREGAPPPATLAVELREPGYLTAEHAALLARFGAAHVLGFAPGAPHASVQARLVLPYAGPRFVRMVDPVAPPYASETQRRAALLDVLARPGQPAPRTFVLVSDQAEGSAPETIERLRQGLQAAASRGPLAKPAAS